MNSEPPFGLNMDSRSKQKCCKGPGIRQVEFFWNHAAIGFRIIVMGCHKEISITTWMAPSHKASTVNRKLKIRKSLQLELKSAEMTRLVQA